MAALELQPPPYEPFRCGRNWVDDDGPLTPQDTGNCHECARLDGHPPPHECYCGAVS